MTQPVPITSTDSPAAIIQAAIAEGRFIQCTLSKPRAASAGANKAVARVIELKGREAVQVAFQFAKKETHENLAGPQAAARLAELLESHFEHGHLFAADADYLFRSRRDGSMQVKRRPPTKEPLIQTHDRTKQYLIPEGTPCPFLVEIGVMNREGAVRAAKRKKFRQINRYLEIVDDIVRHLPRDRPLRVVDFGCGKSYLTFALHHLLTVVHDFEVDVTGLDREPGVVATCRRIAEKLACRGLSFHEGDIQNYTGAERVDLAVSLHACDTATDDALARAVQWEAEVILAVPCCQHELAAMIENRDLSALMAHGILKERFAALATDALRAAALEVCDYATSVVEFIDMEHTAKNVLIRAVRQATPAEDRRRKYVESYRGLKRELSIVDPHLEQVLPQLAERVAE